MFLSLLFAAISMMASGCQSLPYVEQQEQNTMTTQCGSRYFRYHGPAFDRGSGAPDSFEFDIKKAGAEEKTKCLMLLLDEKGFNRPFRVQVNPRYQMTNPTQ